MKLKRAQNEKPRIEIPHNEMKTFEDYQQLALRTDLSADQYRSSGRRADQAIRLLHGSIGIVTEAGELADAMKRIVFYGKNPDFTNIKEELGDLFWYIALFISELQTIDPSITLEAILESNIAKLKARYPEKFTEESALNRDLDAENAALNQ